MIVVSIKKTKNINKDVVATIHHPEYKNVLLNNKCLRYLMNRVESKDHKIKTCEINIISLLCFNDKIHILNKGYDALALGYQS